MDEPDLKKLATTHEFYVGLLLAVSSCFFIGKLKKLKNICIIHQNINKFL